MKHKLLSLLGATLCIAMLSACDPSTFLDEMLGEMTITATYTNANDSTTDSTFNFSSSVVDHMDLRALADPNTIDSTIQGINNIFLGANIELTSSDVIINPYCGFQLKDTIGQDYPITLPLEKSDFANLKPETILTKSSNYNIFIMALSDTAWFVGYDGIIALPDTVNYPQYGYLVDGNINNVKAYYVTQSQINYLTNLITNATNGDPNAISELNNIELNTYFSTITLNGTFSSRRAKIASIIQSLIEKLK